jgi:hypothetical protein
MVNIGPRRQPPRLTGWLEATLALVRTPVRELPPSLLLGLVAANLLLVQGLATVLLDPGGDPLSASSAPSVQAVHAFRP